MRATKEPRAKTAARLPWLRRQTEEPQDAGRSVARTHSWTNGAVLSTRITTSAVVLCLAAGPAGLIWNAVQDSAQPAAASTGPDAGAQKSSQRAGAFAEQFVLAWLRSTRDSKDDLKLFTRFPVDGLPEKAAPVADPVVSSVEGGPGGLYSVVVGVRVQETSPTAKDPVALVWQQRFFRVAVASSDTGVTAATLPAQIAAPSQAPAAPQLAYDQNVGTVGPLPEAVRAFLGAYLTGQGELGRYLSPGSQLSPVTPAPYKTVTLQGVASVKEVPAQAQDGEQINVIATATLADSSGQARVSDYPLTLKARAGRWEVSAMPAIPQLPSPSTTQTTQ